MIRFDNVTLILQERPVLQGLSFEIESGELCLLVGGSGSGKSTILKLILGLIKPGKGHIYIDGKDVTGCSEKALLALRRQFGIVFQEGALFDSLTVEENVGFFLRESLMMPEEEVHRQVFEELSHLGLADFLDYYPAELSGGMKKRVAVARAAVANPKFMLYDEPTAGLDPVAADRVVNLISDLHSEAQVTSLVVTHEIHFFMNRVPRMLMLREGKIVYDGQPVEDIHRWYDEPPAAPPPPSEER